MPRRTPKTEPLAGRLPVPLTVGAWRRSAQAHLAEAGIPSAAAEADLLIAHLLGLRRIDLTLERDRALTPGERSRLTRLLHKRLRRIPIQYLIGEVDFMGIRIEVGPAVLIPRPETEGLVERVLQGLGNAPATVIDVGTGSGAIALALAAARPAWRVWGTDVSDSALRLARRNARLLGLAGRARFVSGDLLVPLRGKAFEPPLRGVVSNPPYVGHGDRERLAPEVRDHEPEIALFAGDDGLDVIARLALQAADALPAGSLFAVEIGEDLGSRVRARLEESGAWRDVAVERDLAGKDRYALAVRAGVGG